MPEERTNLLPHSPFGEVSQDGIRSVVVVLLALQEMVAKTMM